MQDTAAQGFPINNQKSEVINFRRPS